MSAIVSADKTSILVILRREYLEICGNFCAAKLIEYFRHWTNWKLKNHRTPWIYQPLKKIYADLMGEHSLHVIRSAIALLEELGILEKQKNPGNGQDKTWQYKLHLEVLNQLLEHRLCKTEPAKFTVESHHRSNPKTSDPEQQHAAVVEEKGEEIDWEMLTRVTETWEAAQIAECISTSLNTCVENPSRPNPEPELPPATDFVDEQQEIDSLSQIDPQLVLSVVGTEDHDSVPPTEVFTICNHSRNPEACTEFNSLHEVPVDENPELEMPQVIDSAGQLEQVDSTHEIDPHVPGVDQFSPVEPTKSQISEICTELRRLRINPEPCLGVVKKYWANVEGAIARVKEGIHEGWCDNPTGLFINSCRCGAKGKNTVASDVSAWFEWARKQRIVLAMTQGFVYTPSGEAVEIGEMMRQFPLQE